MGCNNSLPHSCHSRRLPHIQSCFNLSQAFHNSMETSSSCLNSKGIRHNAQPTRPSPLHSSQTSFENSTFVLHSLLTLWVLKTACSSHNLSFALVAREVATLFGCVPFRYHLFGWISIILWEILKKTLDKCLKFPIWNVFVQQKFAIFAKLKFCKENQTQKHNYNNIVNNHGLVLGFGVPVACSQQKAKLFL